MALAALITWNYALNDETGFLLQRSTNSGSTWAVNFPRPITTSYVDATVVPDGTYWYRVAATNRYGTGSWSNTGSVFVPPPIPDGPYNLTVVSGSAILTWQSGSNYENYYTVQRNTGGGFADFAVSLIETYTDTLVTSSYTGTTYKYQVAAIDMSGTSSFSNTASILFQWSPLAPTILSVTSQSGYAEITFQSGSAGANAYPFEASLDGTNWYSIGTVGAPPIGQDNHISSSYAGNTYYYRCYAYNAAGSSPYSNIGSITFVWPPPAPQNPIVNSGSADLSWSYSDIGTFVDFPIYRSVNGSGFGYYANVSYPTLTYRDHDVTASAGAGNTYSYQVSANSVGGQTFGPTASINFTSSTPSAPPSGSPDISGSISGSTTPPGGTPDISGSVSGSNPPPQMSCTQSVFAPQQFTESLKTWLDYDIIMPG